MKCSTCKRTFFDKTEMGSHVCKHYACDVCGEKFLRARNVEIHKKVKMQLAKPCFFVKMNLKERKNKLLK